MGENSAIEWTDASWTPIRALNRVTGKVGWHCEHASPGCIHCYSETFNERRLGTGLPFKPGHRGNVEHFLDVKMLLAPLRWRRPRKIFVCSMTDLFGDWVPDAWIDRVFAVMALAPQHTFQVLTKRSARMRAYLQSGRATPVGMEAMDITLHAHARDPRSSVGAGVKLTGDIAHLKVWPLPNVWLGVSAEDQHRFDQRVADLYNTPAALRFFSFEPLLGEINAVGPLSTGAFGWAIVGGESGPSARPMHPDWARSIRDQCAAAGVSFHFKQWGEWLDEAQASRQHCAPGPEDVRAGSASRKVIAGISTRREDRDRRRYDPRRQSPRRPAPRWHRT